MSDGSRIEWTEATWNPVTGCTKVSQGCKHCYAERDWKRLSANPTQPVYHGRAFTDVQCHPERLTTPLLQSRPRRIFVNSMSDLFHEHVPFEFIDQVFAVMACTCRHTYQVLTKRPARMLEYFASRCSGEDFELMGFPAQIQPTEVWPSWVPCHGAQGGYDNCGPGWPLIARDFPWGRWIRVDVAHHYLSVDRARLPVVQRHVRPHVRVIKLSKQGKAIPAQDIDAVAQRIEDAHGNGPACDEKGVPNAWPKPEQAASRSTLAATASSTSRSSARRSSPARSGHPGRSRRVAQQRPSASASSGRAARVLASLSAKVRSGT
jgi:hypothetical protein